MDKVRVETNVDTAIAKYGVSGKGVLVAIMDTGIDWTNFDFRNLDGTTRIAAIFDLTDDTGAHAAGNPYGVGTIYTRTQINAALQGGPQLATRDAVGRGTATAGIIAGSGRNSVNAKYRGIATNATLLVIKAITEGAPAHDNQAAEAPFFDASRIPIAIDFAAAQASALGLPCVMLLNLGSQNGPTDGTSTLSRKIDSTVGPSIPGLAIVTPTGEDGAMYNRSGGVLAPNGALDIRIQKGSAPLTFDLWYPELDRFDVSILNQFGQGANYVSPPGNNDSDTETGPAFTYSQYGSNVTLYGAHNGKREINVQMTGFGGIYTITLRGRLITNGRFDATLSVSQFWNPPVADSLFLNLFSAGSIWDSATAFYSISPNAYNIRTSWTDYDGKLQTLNPNANGLLGDLWSGSSIGPTFDNRFGVDISAPGEEVVATYNPKSYMATFHSNLINDGNGVYGMTFGTRAAAPVVTGIIALMLELNPKLDASTIKNVLHTTARMDSFTGNVPNTVWGYGKVDALKALDAISQIVPVTMAVSHTKLNFGTNAAGTLITSPQTVNLTFTAGPAVAWTAVSLSPNIVVTPSSGTGNAKLRISVLGPGPSGNITINAPGAVNTPRQIQVNIATVTAASPFGTFETPANNAAGVTGAIPVSGWALDNIEVTNVGIWREPVGSEPVASNGLVFIGNATLVAGARPDVEATFPSAPLNYRAGWGYLLLTNFLPNNSINPGPGNGIYKLHVLVTNAAGTTLDLGTRTITADNAHATKPFGTIDTPEQGGTASGSGFINFGWALTPNPAMIPTDGSTIFVVLDGVITGHPVYGNYRPDIANLFPGYQNSTGAIGYSFLDTTKLADGVHTISWNVYDSQGRADGIGSRFFSVSNGVAAAAPEQPVDFVPEASVTLRRDPMHPAEKLAQSRRGEYSVEIAPLGRIELNVGAKAGYLIVNGERRELPLGSTLRSGIFYWQAPVGFRGRYDLLFERPDGSTIRVQVRIR